MYSRPLHAPDGMLPTKYVLMACHCHDVSIMQRIRISGPAAQESHVCSCC